MAERETGQDEIHETGANPASTPAEEGPKRMERDIVTALQTIYDPEVPVDIYEMGLIYDVGVNAAGEVSIKMTLTTPMCPVAESLPLEVESKVRQVEGVTHVDLDLVWDPPWHPGMMSEAARLQLNL